MALGRIGFAAAWACARNGARVGGRQAAGRTPAESDDAGYLAVDALVALTIFASTIVFGLVALHVADQGAAAALEARQARDVLTGVLEQATTSVGVTQSSGRRFSWRLTVQPPVLSAGAVSMCEQDAVAKAKATGREYRLVSARICPAAPSP
jgi:hypothetical protein